MQSITQDLLTNGIPVAEKVIRTIAVYVFLVFGLRLFGKRELGQLNPLDMIVLLLLSNTVQNAIIGNDNSLTGGLIGAGILFVINDMLVRAAYKRPRLRRLIEGRAEELIRDGRILPRALKHNYITHEELVAAARKQGIEDLHTVECARLEVSGQVSFVMREPTLAERHHMEVIQRLDALEKRVAAIAHVFLLACVLGASAAVAPSRAGAQAAPPPSTDVWVVSMHQTADRVALGAAPRNVTARTGYDNQPSFTAKGDAVLYTVGAVGGGYDIWKFSLSDWKPVQVTRTPESEYSATVTPDGRTFSVIRVEADSTQRLWRFPLDGQGAPSVLLPDIKPVGYHVWAGDHTLGLFVLGSPATLQIADDRGGTAEIVARDIGRGLGKQPGRDVITFTQNVRDSANARRVAASWIAEVDLRTKTVQRVAQLPAGADYHVWTPQGALLTASGSKVFAWSGGRWNEIADFQQQHVKNISRLAVSPRGDWLAFVAEDAPKP